MAINSLNKYLRFIVVWPILFATSIGVLPAQSEESQFRTIVPGVEHVRIHRRGGQGKDLWFINMLNIDPGKASIRLAQGLDEIAGAETTSSMAQRYGAVAAINGGYFRTTGIVRGEPVGFLSIGGKILSEPVRNRAALALREEKDNLRIAFPRVSLSADLSIDRRLVRGVDGFNRPREKDELIVYTPEFHRTTLTGPDGVEIVVSGGRAIEIHDGQGSLLVPPNGLILSASGSAGEFLKSAVKKGSRIEISTRMDLDPEIGFRPDFILGGGPRLLAGGKLVIDEDASSYAEGFYSTRHPRTAIGRRSDGRLVLLTVDGRQPEKSIGMSIAELAGLMLELGCIEAMNLDGGGSTTMVVRNEIVNLPSDKTGERPVSDALLVFVR